MQYCLECPGTHLPGSAEGRVWGRAGRANPHRAGVSAPGPLPLGTRGKSAENRRALPPAAPRPLPGRPDLPFSPQSPAGISPAQAGARSLTLQRGVRAAGRLPPPGWSPAAGSLLQAGPLEFPLSSAAPSGGRWGGQRGVVVCLPSRGLSRPLRPWPPPAQALPGGDPAGPELAESPGESPSSVRRGRGQVRQAAQ